MVKGRKKPSYIILWITVITWMMLIFYLSSQVEEQSDNLSTNITKVIIESAEKVSPQSEFSLYKMNRLVRKNAHFIAYLVLGMLVVFALRSSGKSGLKSFGVALMICVLYAISDELHQLFVPGRGAQMRDVIIDSAGAIVGISMSFLPKLFLLNSKYETS
ncbi:VanZ family protein [Cytobacillus sp. IB215665]|uniref:VanZ family protein n=1 Tax=Cytobacillus sp. IB215665 TaxID=3097357 RepID=UPI002A15664A|nr:VanZ family protein [Cytobacillus sp. IB215665]MDX8363735.1 VanZ family protein [Cytobacillus sp. IB215665]